nr:hypothetical protein [Tanacetum cinerariifolium]
MVQEFQIRFDLDLHHTRVINEWLKFAVNKKVEILEVDFMEKSRMTMDHRCNYVFPLRLSDRNIAHLFKEFLANSPHLETIIIHGSGHLKHICIGGRYIVLRLVVPLQKDFKPDSLPELTNVKKLTLTVGAHKDDYLIEFASLANACPNLETFTVKVLWYSPFKRRREARSVDTHHPHQHLKLL